MNMIDNLFVLFWFLLSIDREEQALAEERRVLEAEKAVHQRVSEFIFQIYCHNVMAVFFFLFCFWVVLGIKTMSSRRAITILS